VAEKDEEKTSDEEKPKPKRKPAAKKAEGKKAEGGTEGKKAEGEKPKRKPAAKKPAAKKPAAPKAEKAKAEEAKAEESKADEAKAEETKAAEDPKAEATQDKPQSGGRRRGGAAAAGRRSRAPRRSDNGDVTVRARARYVRCAPRKARLVIDHIRGKDVDQARAILMHTPRAASRDVLKLLESAIANAENNHELVADELRVGKAYVDEGPTLKRYRPRALGRATRIRKRTSHLTIELTSKE
jgi:ribosomal protein L22